MKSVRTRPLSAALLSVALTVGVLGGAVGPASAAYDPSAPPYPSDPDSATSLSIHDVVSGAVIDHGSTSDALSGLVFESATDFSPKHSKAVLSGFLAEAGKAPGSWSGSLLGAATAYTDRGFTTPTASGGSTDSFDALAGSYPNKAASSSDFYQLYQLRVRTTFPAPQSTSYAFVDIQIDPAAHTWRQVNPAPAVTKTAPGSPTGVTATPGNGTARVTFTPPASDGNDAITGYTVTATPTAGGAAVVQPTTGTSTTVTGLTNGTSYDVTVTASNSTGTSTPSAPAQVTPAATVPSAPTAVRAVARDNGVTVTFQAPATDGGSPVTSYTVTASTGQTATGSGTAIGLTVPNGTARTYTVTATNAVGTSARSAASNSVAFFTTRLTASVTAAINAGSRITLRGALNGGSVAGKRLVATIATSGHGSRLLALTTASNGTYATSFVASSNTAVTVRYAATSTQRAATSPTVRTAVRTIVRITSPTSGTRTRTRTLAVTGTTSPNKAGQYVTLYERRSTGYVKLVSVKIASNGTYRFVRTFSKATHVLQVRIAAVTYNSAGNSNVVTLYEV